MKNNLHAFVFIYILVCFLNADNRYGLHREKPFLTRRLDSNLFVQCLVISINTMYRQEHFTRMKKPVVPVLVLPIANTMSLENVSKCLSGEISMLSILPFLQQCLRVDGDILCESALNT